MLRCLGCLPDGLILVTVRLMIVIPYLYHFHDVYRQQQQIKVTTVDSLHMSLFLENSVLSQIHSALSVRPSVLPSCNARASVHVSTDAKIHTESRLRN